MALFPLYFDVVNKVLVTSETNPAEYKLPELHQEDGLEIELTVLKRISNRAPFFEKVNVAGYDLQVSVGTAGTINASESGFTKINGNTTFSGELDLSTSKINALTDNTEQLVEIRLFNSTVYYRGQFKTRIRKSVATSGATQPVTSDTALGSSQANRIYMRKEGRAGEGFILTSPDGTKQVLCYLDDAGTFRTDPIS